MKKRAGAPCDKDCFHCKFSDCIYDRLDAEDYAQSRATLHLLTSKAKSPSARLSWKPAFARDGLSRATIELKKRPRP